MKKEGYVESTIKRIKKLSKGPCENLPWQHERYLYPPEEASDTGFVDIFLTLGKTKTYLITYKHYPKLLSTLEFYDSLSVICFWNIKISPILDFLGNDFSKSRACEIHCSINDMIAFLPCIFLNQL